MLTLFIIFGSLITLGIFVGLALNSKNDNGEVRRSSFYRFARKKKYD